MGANKGFIELETAIRNVNRALPLEADNIMSGYWGVVAIWVTHPPWPWRVPLSVICSVILLSL